VAKLGPYFAELGVSHLYLSPIGRAREGSPHGYDVVAPDEFDPALGDAGAFERMATELKACGVGLVLDVVPNHLCVLGTDNAWWLDVLENGPSSPFARCFDVDWSPPKPDLADKVLLPVLGEPFGRALAAGRLRLERQRAQLWFDCAGLRLPLAPRSWPLLLVPARERLGLDPLHPTCIELDSLLTAIEHLPSRAERAPDRVAIRRREKGVIAARLERLLAAAPDLAAALDAELAYLGEPASIERLEALLAEQGYRLAWWRVAADEINYRRFFDVNDLAAIRVEEPAVFDAVHALPLDLVARGLVDGLRIDHVDGLYDPRAYLDRLGAVPWVGVEKILAAGEELPGDWPVAGTTGYEFLVAADGLFVEPDSEPAFRALWERVSGRREKPAEAAFEARRLVLQVSLGSELTALARRLDRISEQHRDSRDFTLRGLEHALAEVIACFPVYRTYLRPDAAEATPVDAAHVRSAVAEARRRNPAQSGDVFDFVADVLLGRHPEGLSQEQLDARRDFALRFQQLTGPVAAKGGEDTAAYRHFPLASRCEVGAEPGAWATSRDVFHAFAERRQRLWPLGLSATSTHDTKRDEDARARLNVLSEIPEEWAAAVDRCREALAPARTNVQVPGGGFTPALEPAGGLGAEELRLRRSPHGTGAGLTPAPEPVDEYLFLQAALASWPAEVGAAPGDEYRERLRGYMSKAIREAKLHTSWTHPNHDYERAVDDYVVRALDPGRSGEFLAELRRLVERVARPGQLNALALTVLKAAAPGVPDFYQGTECPEFRLVDPDNRGRVDFERRAHVLRSALPEDPLAALRDGSLKLHVTRRALRLRARRPELFATGDYVPLAVRGRRERHVVAFARARGGESALAVVGRFFARMSDPPIGSAWADTELVLPPELGRRFRDVVGEREIRARADGANAVLPLDALFARLPVALLERED
jgi:(1->4)-alpha-D-glucan 1-alpha-D-glucosylmutase